LAKDPAVLFYYQDFLVGTSFFTNEQIGAYIRILCHLYDKDTLPEQTMFILCGSEEIWSSIKDKFVKDTNGQFYNRRARDEKQKRVKFTESRSDNRKTKHKENHLQTDMLNISLSSVKDMEDENEDEDSNENINHEKGVENKKSAEGIMFRIWGRKPNNIEERRLLDELWLEADEDPKIVEHAFRQSVKYDSKKFPYVAKVIANMKLEKEKLKTKEREREAAVKKYEESKNFVPDPKMKELFAGISKSLNPFTTGGEQKKELTKEETLARKRSVDEFNREIKKGTYNG